MSYVRFIQIHRAFHLESSESKEGDKCLQLRNAKSQKNKATMKTFIPWRELSFDEDGISSKSRYNPVRQFSSSKPDKYRIDFLLLLIPFGHNFIYLIDVYQGKNKNNIMIPLDLWPLPTTQKAVVNAMVSTGLYRDPSRYRSHYMDNLFTAPGLIMMLKSQLKIFAFGTISIYRKGWEQYLYESSKFIQDDSLNIHHMQKTEYCLDNRKITIWYLLHQPWHKLGMGL